MALLIIIGLIALILVLSALFPEGKGDVFRDYDNDWCFSFMEFIIVILCALFSYWLVSKIFKPGKPDPFRNYDND